MSGFRCAVCGKEAIFATKTQKRVTRFSLPVGTFVCRECVEKQYDEHHVDGSGMWQQFIGGYLVFHYETKYEIERDDLLEVNNEDDYTHKNIL